MDSIVPILTILLVNVALSGDNAIVIGCAAAALPKKERRFALIFGGGLAVVLRIILTVFATLLTNIPLVSAVGGIVLFWVAWKLLRMNIEAEETEEFEKARQAGSFRQAIGIIATADLVMSLDNIIAIAGTAQGDIKLVIIGLLLSMPLILLAGGGLSLLIDKYKWLLLIGAAAIVFAGTRMIFLDKFIEPRVSLNSYLIYLICGAAAVAMPAFSVWFRNRKYSDR